MEKAFSKEPFLLLPLSHTSINMVAFRKKSTLYYLDIFFQNSVIHPFLKNTFFKIVSILTLFKVSFQCLKKLSRIILTFRFQPFMYYQNWDVWQIQQTYFHCLHRHFSKFYSSILHYWDNFQNSPYDPTLFRHFTVIHPWLFKHSSNS